MVVRSITLWAFSLPLLGALLAAASRADEGRPAANEKEAKWGELRGRVVWKGDKIPQSTKVDVGNHPDRECCLKNGPLTTEDWVINPRNRGIQWVFVWLQPDPDEGPKVLPIHPTLREVKQKEVVLKEMGCRYVPHALALREGQRLIVKNLDTVHHAFRLVGDPEINPSVGVLVAPNSNPLVIKDLKPQNLPLVGECNIHPWMRCWIWVYSHPYHAITDADGKFEIKHAPAGKWRVKVWHEQTGWRGGKRGKDGDKIEIKDAGATDLGDWPLNP